MTGERRSAAFISVGLFVLAVLVSCCGFSAQGMRDGDTTTITTPPSPTAATISGSVVLAANGTTLRYTPPWLGCGNLNERTEDQQTGVTVSISVAISPCDLSRAKIESPVSYDIPLNTPLADRPVIDAVGGQTVPVFREQGALHPPKLPAGAQPGSPYGIVASRASGFGGPGSATMSSAFPMVPSQPGTSAPVLLLVQTTGAWLDAGGVTTKPVTVRGRRGLIAPGILVWQEAGQTCAVVWQMPVGLTPPPAATLVTFANALVRTAVPA